MSRTTVQQPLLEPLADKLVDHGLKVGEFYMYYPSGCLPKSQGYPIKIIDGKYKDGNGVIINNWTWRRVLRDGRLSIGKMNGYGSDRFIPLKVPDAIRAVSAKGR